MRHIIFRHKSLLVRIFVVALLAVPRAFADDCPASVRDLMGTAVNSLRRTHVVWSGLLLSQHVFMPSPNVCVRGLRGTVPLADEPLDVDFKESYEEVRKSFSVFLSGEASATYSGVTAKAYGDLSVKGRFISIGEHTYVVAKYRQVTDVWIYDRPLGPVPNLPAATHS